MELARADWIRDDGGRRRRRRARPGRRGSRRCAGSGRGSSGRCRASPTHQARQHHHAVATSTAASRWPTARRREKIEIVPNGVALRTPQRSRRPAATTIADDASASRRAAPAARRLRRAAWSRSRISSPSSARATSRCATVDLDVRVIGPADEDPGYAARCRAAGRAARARDADPVRRAACRRADLRRPGPRRADQLQRGTAAGHPGGLRRRASRSSPPTSAPAAR